VPRVESKLRVFAFRIQFNSQVGKLFSFMTYSLYSLLNSFSSPFVIQVSELRQNLNIVNSASEEASGVIVSSFLFLMV